MSLTLPAYGTSIPAPVGGLSTIGFNLRKTPGLTYPAGDNRIGGAGDNLFPTAYADNNAAAVNAGWTPTAAPNPAYIYDVVVTPVRLQGAQGVVANWWRTERPSGKTYRVRLGFCIYVANNIADIYIRDGSFGGSIEYSMTMNSPMAAFDAIDVLGNVTSADQWEADYASRYVDIGPITDLGGGMGELTVEFRTTVSSGYVSHIGIEELP